MKGVILAAGLGTRMLPATKSQPKEMLPVAKKPVIQYIVEEFAQTGIKDILIVTGKNKRAIEDHFDRDPALLRELSTKNKVELLHELEALEELDVHIFYTRQAIPTGLADAVNLAKEFCCNDDFVLALGDTMIDCQTNPIHLKRLIDYHQEADALCTLSGERIPMELCSRYGIMDITPFSPSSETSEGKFWVKNLIEKPSPEKAPSNLAICGRYVFKSAIFDYLSQVEPGKGGEKQLTDGIQLARSGGKIAALELGAGERRYDTGAFSLYAIAFVDYCLKDKEIGPELRKHLSTLDL